MCCFSGAVQDVSDTQIFARALGEGRQLVVYGMTVSLDAGVAMVLPLPTRPDTGEAGLRFVDLSGCPDFFKSLDALFPIPRQSSRAFQTAAAAPAPAPLAVHRVGAFEASFVPTLADFSRLDARFRLSDEVWRQLPEYAEWGFAVFKLQRGARQRVHPMAFDFPRRDPGALFFPTVHVHDGALHERAAFSHTLYAQPPADWEPWMTWARASRPTTELNAKARPFVGVLPLFRTRLSGELPNRDTWLDGAVLSGRYRETPHARVRVLTAWEHLAGPGRGAPKSPAGLDPMVWKELQVTEPQRREACARVASELEQALTAEPDALPFDETLPEVWPELPSPPFAPPPPSARGYQVRLSSPATTVMSIEARVAFRVSPSPATLARLRAVLARA